MFESIHIVWNMTNRCPEKCSFCAAAACQDASDSSERKFQILKAILAANLPTEIDFSGGNPWSGEGGLEIMAIATKALGKQNISISGLGSSLIGGGGRLAAIRFVIWLAVMILRTTHRTGTSRIVRDCTLVTAWQWNYCGEWV